ncbi:unnamed protein product [Effrenium voratum]|uniref:Kinesin-like protein n=1 Tax=Effrenium voratum TaxID=2562239 RepID=A0AA36HSZ3_9DINO|nr:unnamed protein product [Effrenium voratum]
MWQKQQVEEGVKLEMAVLASYLEIYQEKMFDLLVSTRTDLQVRLHPTLGPHVPGLIQSPVTNSKEVNELLDFGAKNRAVGATSMNANSSRSHAIFTLDIRLSYSGSKGKDLQSRIHFVDLAGSEKQKKTHASGERLQEGIAINQSLSSLSRVIQALAGTSGIQPVFRESKLTLLLKEALSGNSRTVLLACISPARSNHDESVSTLEFAARCKLIKTHAKKNEQDKKVLIETLAKEKEDVEGRLEAERQQKLLLQQELEREREEVREKQEFARSVQEEKQRIEEMLRKLQDEQENQKGKDEAQKGELERIQQKKAEEESERMKLQAELLQLRRKEEEERQRLEAERASEERNRKLLQEALTESEKRERDLKNKAEGLENLKDSFQADMEKKAQEHKMQRDNHLKKLGIAGLEAFEDSSTTPYLVNMNPDKSLEGCLMIYLPLGETRIGADFEKCNVCLTGVEVAKEVCVITREKEKEGTEEPEKMQVERLGDALVRVNGCQVEGSSDLESGDRLAIGRAHIFRVVIPGSSSEETVESNFEKAMKELQDKSQVDPRWRGAVDEAVMIVKRDKGTEEARLSGCLSYSGEHRIFA